jgi:hypothetical protein
MLLLSPLEQFQILSLITIKLFGFDFSITNALLINLIALLCFSSTLYCFSSHNNCLNKSSVFFIRKSSCSLEKLLKVLGVVDPETATKTMEGMSAEQSLIISIIIIRIAVAVLPFVTSIMADRNLDTHYPDIESLLELSKETLIGNGSLERFQELMVILERLDSVGQNDYQLLTAHLYGRESKIFQSISRFLETYSAEEVDTVVRGIPNAAQYDHVILSEFELAFCQYMATDTAIFDSLSQCELLLKFYLLS